MKKKIEEPKATENWVDVIVNRLKSHKAVAVVVVAAGIIVGLGTVTDSIDRIGGFIFKHLSDHPSGDQRPKAPVSLLNNGGFEDGFQSWGSGHYETQVYRGALGGPFWASWVAEDVAAVRGDLVTDVKHSGDYSLKITNSADQKAHIYGSISQRVTGLEPNADYVAEFWVKADRASSGTLQLTTDLPWLHRTSIPRGTYGWTKRIHRFKSGDETHVDYRIVSDEPGTAWVDDMTMKRVLE